VAGPRRFFTGFPVHRSVDMWARTLSEVRPDLPRCRRARD